MVLDTAQLKKYIQKKKLGGGWLFFSVWVYLREGEVLGWKERKGVGRENRRKK